MIKLTRSHCSAEIQYNPNDDVSAATLQQQTEFVEILNADAVDVDGSYDCACALSKPTM